MHANAATDDTAAKIVDALTGARERILERESLADERVLSRGSLAEHVAIELDRSGTILTIRVTAKTQHGARIVAELEATNLDLPKPALH
jgi:hypothetical protein